MKIVQVNKTLPPISQGFTELGHEVVKVSLNQGERAILREIDRIKPELVIFHKLGDKDPMLTRKASKNYRTWFWMPDPMFNVRGRALENIPQHALNCIYRSAPSPIHVRSLQMATRNNRKVHMIPNVIPDEYRYVEGVEQEYDIGFLGTKYKFRQRALTTICKGRSMLLHGGGYPAGKVSGIGFATAVGKTRIQLNMAQRDDWPGILSSRSYRILACRGFMMAQVSRDFDGMLFPGEHFIAWNTPKEARKISEYYLDTNSGRDEAEEIAECGERWVLDRYRPIHSARKMLEVIGV
jgi:hypothetical protein